MDKVNLARQFLKVYIRNIREEIEAFDDAFISRVGPATKADGKCLQSECLQPSSL